MGIAQPASPTEAIGSAPLGVIAGLAGSVILLLKAPASVPLLVGACVLLAFEQRWRLRQWLPLLGWIAVGLLPGCFGTAGMSWNVARMRSRSGAARAWPGW